MYFDDDNDEYIDYEAYEAEFVQAQTISVDYRCEDNHQFSLKFSAEASPPDSWKCKCGKEANIVAGKDNPQAAPDEESVDKNSKTHWEMLLERRSIPELEKILDKQLKLYYSGELKI